MLTINTMVQKIRVDRLLHYFVCWALFMSLANIFDAWLAALIVFGIGVCKEVIDIFRGTGFDVFDLVADVCGILTGWLVLWLTSFVG